MDAYDLPAAIIASSVMGVLVWVGVNAHLSELKTGKEPRGFTAIVLTACVVFGGLGIFALDHPLWGDVAISCLGVLIGLSAAYYALRFRHQRTSQTQQHQPPRRSD